MKANNYLITVTELKTMGYIPVESIPPDSNLIVSKATANTFYYIPYAEPWNSLTNDRCPKYQDFPISCYSYATVANTLEGNPDPVFISYQDCSGNFIYSSVPFGQALIINQCYYVSGDSGPMTGCGILANSIYAPGCEITYSTRCDIPTSECTTTTSTTSTTTTLPPVDCYVVQGYVDGADLNHSYNFEVCFDWYDCEGSSFPYSYCTSSEGGFTLPSNCYNPTSIYGAPFAYIYEYPGGPKVAADYSYIDGYTPCSGTTTTTTTQPPGCVVPNLPVTLYSINRYVYPNLFSRLYPYNSADGGRSWTILPCVSSLPDIDFRMISTSYDGTYILLAGKFPTTQLVSRYMYISTDGGNTISAGRDIYQELTGTQGYITAVAVSGNGQYMAMFAGSGVTGESLYKLIVSSDYGVNWSIRYSVANEGGTAYSPRGIAISNDGQYITGCIYGTGLFAGETKSKRIYSSNYGTSFTLSGGTNLQDFSDIAFSSSGQYQVIASLVGNTNGRVLLSTNYGANWTEKVFMVNYELSAIAITDNGSNIFASGSTGGYTFSKDYGSTFEAHYFPQTSITGLTMSNSLIGSDTLVTLYIAAATNYPATQIAYFSDTGGSYWCGAYINSLVNSAQSRGNI